MKNIEIGYLLDFYAPLLTQKQQEILDMHYNHDLSLAEIAQSGNTTRQAVMDALKRGQTALYDLEEKLGLVHKYRATEKLLVQCKEWNEQGMTESLAQGLDALGAIWEDSDGL